MIHDPNKSLNIIIDGKNQAPKVLESEHYHGSEGDAKLEAVVESTGLATFSLPCTASCRTLHLGSNHYPAR
jgi:hypothetical protein